jgi:glucokinase
MILAGDIGGTSTRLALFEVKDGRLRAAREKTYPSREHSGLTQMVGEFLKDSEHRVKQACFGISGPVRNGRGQPSNLPWSADTAELKSALDIGSVWLINDLEANAFGIAALGPDDFALLSAGRGDAPANAAVISAGTGLGEAGLYWDGRQHLPFAAEGGHADFAPRDEREIELLRYLLTSYEHVSYERVLSGPGLHNIYRFLKDTGRGSECDWVREAMQREDPSSVISKAALDATCALCEEAMAMFVSIYGAAAGNLVLKYMATGGLYIGGGIAPKILAKLRGPAFMQAFTAKGRLSPLCEATPVRVITNPKTALLGTARYAALQAQLMS